MHSLVGTIHIKEFSENLPDRPLKIDEVLTGKSYPPDADWPQAFSVFLMLTLLRLFGFGLFQYVFIGGCQSHTPIPNTPVGIYL